MIVGEQSPSRFTLLFSATNILFTHGLSNQRSDTCRLELYTRNEHNGRQKGSSSQPEQGLFTLHTSVASKLRRLFLQGCSNASMYLLQLHLLPHQVVPVFRRQHIIPASPTVCSGRVRSNCKGAAFPFLVLANEVGDCGECMSSS